MNAIILLVGKSGSGKNWILEKFENNNDFVINPVCSYTTRPIRENETEGVEHYFVDKNFYKNFNKDIMIAYTYYNGNHYWASIDEITKNNKNIYIIDPEGVIFFKNKIIDLGLDSVFKSYTYYIDTSLFRRIKNMYNRKDKLIDIIKRIVNDFFAFSVHNISYDYKIKIKYEKKK